MEGRRNQGVLSWFCWQLGACGGWAGICACGPNGEMKGWTEERSVDGRETWWCDHWLHGSYIFKFWRLDNPRRVLFWVQTFWDPYNYAQKHPSC